MKRRKFRRGVQMEGHDRGKDRRRSSITAVALPRHGFFAISYIIYHKMLSYHLIPSKNNLFIIIKHIYFHLYYFEGFLIFDIYF